MIVFKSVLCFAILLSFNLKTTFGHGFLDEPVARSTAWQKDRYKNLVPINYNHMALNCGGGTDHDPEYGQKCGVCGDALSLPSPRPNENGGMFSRLVDGQVYITRDYKQGQQIDIRFKLTANHKGHAEFSICPLENDNMVETEECFAKYRLKELQYIPEQNDICPQPHKDKIIVCSNKNIYELKATLPKDLSCEHCVLRWHYRAANNWGYCNGSSGYGRLGCGSQEIFRGCSDIRIGTGNSAIHRPNDSIVPPKPAVAQKPRNDHIVPPRPPVYQKPGNYHPVPPKPPVTQKPQTYWPMYSPKPVDTAEQWPPLNMKKCWCIC